MPSIAIFAISAGLTLGTSKLDVMSVSIKPTCNPATLTLCGYKFIRKSFVNAHAAAFAAV
ncbi:hypothetical protein D3C81_2222790 [compost metagenome]